MDEQNFRQQLHKYLDGELPDAESRALESFIEAHPLAKVEFENEKKFDQIVRQYLVPAEAPYELRESVIGQLQARNPWEQFRNLFKPKQALAGIFAVVAVCLISVFVLNQRNQFPVFTEAVSTHIDYLHGSYDQEIMTADIDQALAWFNGKLDFAVTRPHLASDRATLLGARIIRVNGQKAAYFMYNVNGKSVSAFVLNLENERMASISDSMVVDHDDASVYAKNLKGYENILCYHKNIKTGCLFVTDMPKDEFLSLMG